MPIGFTLADADVSREVCSSEARQNLIECTTTLRVILQELCALDQDLFPEISIGPPKVELGEWTVQAAVTSRHRTSNLI